MQLPDLLNKNNLFFNLNGLDVNGNNAIDQVKVEIIARGTSSLLHLIRIQELNKRCLREFELYEDQLNNINNQRIVFSSESLGFLLNEVSPLLGTLRLLQNLSIKLIKLKGYNSLPKSISDYIKKPIIYKLDSILHEAILTHWNSTGKMLKNYRDIDQHYQWLTGRYFIQLVPIRKILIEFPDNPEEKSINKFTYEKSINGIDFLSNAFSEIHSLIEKIAIYYGSKRVAHQHGVMMDQLGDLTPFNNRTLSFIYSNYFEEVGKKTTIKLEGIGIDQSDNGQLSVRKYFLEGDKLNQAKALYGIMNDS